MSWLGKLHDWKYSKYIDPVGWYSQDTAARTAPRLVNESSRALVKAGDALGISTNVPEYGLEKSQKDKESPGRFFDNTVGGIGAVLGGMYALGYEGAGAAGASGAGSGGGGVASGNGAFLGEGVASGVPAWDGAAGGMGLGFNPEGITMPKGNYDIPGGVNGQMPQGMGGMNMGGMGQQQQGRYSGGRQNLPLYENEKTDQQKLAELLTALQNQQGVA